MSHEKTMNQQAIEKLEEDIKQSREELRAKHEMLDLLQDTEATPFIETRLARSFFHTVKFLTSPFAKLHKVHSAVLEDPQGYRREKLLDQTEDILKTAEHLKLDKQAKGMAVLCGKQVVRMEEEARRSEWPAGDIPIAGLRVQVERLRSKESKERREEMRKTLEVVTEPGAAPEPQPA